MSKPETNKLIAHPRVDALVKELYLALGRAFLINNDLPKSYAYFKQVLTPQKPTWKSELDFRASVYKQLISLGIPLNLKDLLYADQFELDHPRVTDDLLKDFANFLQVDAERLSGSSRSATFDGEDVFFKAYALEAGHFTQELGFFKSDLSGPLSPWLPQFLGEEVHGSCKILRFEKLEGTNASVYYWPALIEEVLRVLATHLYRPSLKAMTAKDFISAYQSELENHPDEFEDLAFFLNQADELGEVALCQVHGDLKLPNVMLVDEGWKLVDWEATTLAPIYVDLLKGILDFTRREKNKKILLNVPALLKEQLIKLTEVLGLDASNRGQVKANLLASVLHFVAQEVRWGNQACLKSNYQLLLPLVLTLFED